MKDESCIFCKIANGDIPADTLYEDEDFRVILDLNPASEGHALILPKDHFADLYEMDEAHLQKVLCVAQKVAKAMTEALHCDGMNLIQNNGEAAGQTVRHFHLHLIPRRSGDDAVKLWTPGVSVPDRQKEIVKAVRACL